MGGEAPGKSSGGKGSGAGDPPGAAAGASDARRRRPAAAPPSTLAPVSRDERRRAHQFRVNQFKRARRSQFLRDLAIHLPLIIIGAMMALALVLVVADRWRRGAFTFGVGTLLAAWFRLILPDPQAGLLAVRSRRFDVAALTLSGSVILWLTLSIDPLGTG